MFVIIIDNNTVIKENVNTFYKYKGINIYKEDNYYIDLQDGYYFNDGTKKKLIELKEYIVCKGNYYNDIHIFFYENDNGLNDFSFYENDYFELSNRINATIINADKYSNNYYLTLNNNYLETNSNFLFVNHKKYNGSLLCNGDYVEYLGFSFFYYDDYLYINKFNVKENLLNVKLINEKIIHYSNIQPNINNYYVLPKKGIEIEKLNEFAKPHKGNNRKLILQIGPTITMSMAMVMMACINVYNTVISSGNKANIVSYIIMPLTMLISGILWPILSSNSDKTSYKKSYKKAKSEYLQYLKEYEENLIKRINSYLKEEKEYLFNINDIENRLFYIDSKSKEFLKITLGYQKVKLPISVKYTNDKEIDEYLNRIKYRVENIEEVPLYLDIKNNKKITIIKNKNRDLIFKKILLELIYKYSYEDIIIGIYSKKNNAYNDIFNIPHTIYQNERLTFINERELQDINNKKIDKPLILLLNDYTEYKFTNKQIHLILFSESKKDILKDSDVVVELNNNNGIYIKDEKIFFNYYDEIIDYKKYFNYISLFNNNISNNNKVMFKDIYPNINVINNYLLNRDSLKADFAIIGEDLLSFDLHEKLDGPHGLIGGSTGSGKSELIISLLLSLAIRYSPEYLNIILIDYKGGGIKESLSYNSNSIPHIIAAINNLEEDTFERLIVAISRECRKRQKLFKDLSIKALSSIMNIDEYLAINEEFGFENIAHLLIVVDEFAELKKENPTIIKELISVSRIGRSLGVHLILATQRPNGSIDDEIWSNSHFKIALKVHSEKDSQDIIKTKDAAYLLNPGEFYLQVDDNTIKAKSIYSKRDINNNDEYEVCLLDNRLKQVKKKKFKKENPFSEASYLSKLIIDSSNTLNIKQNKLEFEIPKQLSLNELKNKYQNNNGIIFGEIDDYLNAKKGLLEYKIDENLLVYSNRKNEINNIINIINKNERQIIVISNKKYNNNYISDSILYEDEEDINYLFTKLIDDTDTNLSLIIEDVSAFISYNEDYSNDIFQLIRRSNASNYSLILLTKETNINFKIINSIKNKVVIEIHDSQDLINFFSEKGIYRGKSFFYNESLIPFIPTTIEKIDNNEYISLKNYVDRIPSEIYYEYTRNKLLIGYDNVTRHKVFIKDNEILLISSYDNELLSFYKFLFIQNTNIHVMLYNNDLIRENYQNVLWIGDGISCQRLFYVDNDYDLNKSYGFLFKANKGRIIRTVNHE